MEPILSTPPPTVSRQDDNASTAPLSSSPRTASSSANDKTDESFLSSDPADQSLLRHPKGKRKRTAAKDKAILESAYLANTKPDKTARLSIVSQVSLNEKEVQIWFQNRRQNDRRKSRPLSPQEIAALRYGGMHALSSDLPVSYMPSSLHQHSSFSDGAGASSPPQLRIFNSASMNLTIPTTTPASSPEMGPWMPDALARRMEEQRQHELARDRDQASSSKPVSAPMEMPQPSQSFASSTSSIGYLANRWNTHSSFSMPSSLSGGHSAAGVDRTRDETTRLEPFVGAPSAPAVVQPPQQQAPPKPSHHRPFRLSLSLEGKAEVISSLSPSPPRRLPLPHPTIPVSRRSGSSSSNGSDAPLPSLPAIRRSGLSRSQSALPGLGSLTLPPITSLTSSLPKGSTTMPQSQPPHPPRFLRGRSRDVHAWESVCDAEARVDDELSAHAEDEASGSAIAAISLLRSTSSASSTGPQLTSMLQTNSNRRNTPTRSGPVRPGMKRAKLGRALSSVARMQSVPGPRDASQENAGKDKAWMDDEKRKKLKLSTILSGNDSDKENWSPDEEDRPVPGSQYSGANTRRPLPGSRPALGSGADKGNKSAHLVTRPLGGKLAGGAFSGLDIYEDASGRSNNGTPAKRLQFSRAVTVPAANEVERFMHGTEVSPGKRGDMDCVAGLLSLSQGNWR